MKLKRFAEINEGIGNKSMKRFILNTQSESGDDYIYFIEHPTLPTDKELRLFLSEYAKDQDDDQVYENIQMITEIPNNFNRISSTAKMKNFF